MFRRRVSPRRVVVEDHIISFHFVLYLSSVVKAPTPTTKEKTTTKHESTNKKRETKRELVLVFAPSKGGGGVRGYRCRSDTKKYYIYRASFGVFIYLYTGIYSYKK